MYRFSEPDLESWAKEAEADSVEIRPVPVDDYPGEELTGVVVIKGHLYVAMAFPKGVDEFPATTFVKAKYAFERAER